jgi:hypothetical protein
MPRDVRIAAAVTAAVLLATLTGCPRGGPSLDLSRLSLGGMDDRDRVALVLDDVHAGMQGGRIYKVLAHVSRAYQDADGRDYEAVRAYLSDLFREYRDIRITRPQPRIVVQGDQARAVETFATRARATNPGARGEFSLQGQVTVHLAKEDGRWRIVRWGRLQ